MNIKKIVVLIFVILMLATAINYFTGTTIVMNGNKVTGVGGFIAAYLALVLLATLLVIVIPSALILIAALLMVFGIFFAMFFPLLPLAFLLLPGVVFAGVVYLIYKLTRKKN
ncbi:MAG TPA: hypothetical protein VJW95_00405 [Dissulfurispiraceae bacterium]|nr:hypothetical protein [Dissulfurispiraceae bacterium]